MQLFRSPFARSAIAVGLVLPSLVGCQPAASRPSHENVPSGSEAVDRLGAPGRETLPTASIGTIESERPGPKARVDHDIHDFGRMNAHLKGEHFFVIHNIGDAPLVLEATETSCSCTVGNVPAEPVAPGESARVRVQWTAKSNGTRFRETITLKTNDPQQPEVLLIVAGTVCREVDAQPINFGDLAPDASREMVSLITSTVLDRFELAQIGCTISGVEWEATPATAEQLQAAQAKSGWQLRVRLSDAMPLGDFQGSLRFRLKPVKVASAADGDESPQLDQVQYEVPIAGKLLRRIAVHGPRIDWTGTISVGTVGQGQGFTGNYIVKIRDPDKTLRLVAKRVAPEWMQVEFEPYAAQDPSRGLYRMKLTIPPDAPISDFTTGRPATIQLAFDHPRAPSLDLNVVFAIVNGGRAAPR